MNCEVTMRDIVRPATRPPPSASQKYLRITLCSAVGMLLTLFIRNIFGY